jgi:hypothetical protein
MSELEKEITGIKRQLCCLRGDIKELQDLIGDGVGFEQAENFSALPPAADNNGKYYHVLNSQGTKWLPGWVGGTFYSKGFYYSDGVDWVFVGDVPYNATQTEVNTGTNTTQFVTPATLASLASATKTFDDKVFEGKDILKELHTIYMSELQANNPKVEFTSTI